MIKVMIVEDDPMVAALNRQFVGRMDGFEVIGTAGNAQQAIAILAKSDVDLVLLDIHMPGLTGIEFLQMLREQKQDLDVILITAASEIQQIQHALRLGASDYLIKPFEFSRFQEALLQYQSHFHKLHVNKQISQQEIDSLLGRKQQSASSSAAVQHLPKGLTKTTLQTIQQVILSNESAVFSTDELAQSARISRVSVRKYLKFLSAIGYLQEDLTYGVGRPIYQYRVNPQGASHLDSYL
ncbi:response regulator [Planococcus sp. CP5-4]|uniref:response regulator n=1 Tax=unclassified Planococcus (in: firmicutes) TaxID=2662419 RepID=UPI001C24D5AF|nr:MULTISPECIES: response regulator [unclassified Planococcus (in: firmicutes)]MBU9674223.1 response regulator [Planococcus sp. CP5-4_YE]MBV0909305.1 response regulator [Planococcus sp. CP5-4_UN]MBW6063797.1 response regulator [Planococcus sp. CP5-4]